MFRIAHVVALALGLGAWAAPLRAGQPPPAPKADEGKEPEQPAAHLQLRVRVSNLSNDEGVVAVALFKNESDFPDQERALRGKLSKIKGKRASVVFRNLEAGIYAVAMLHDENENAEMDFNFLGMPLEGYGFSNDASATFGPPDFAEAAFRLRAKASVIDVKTRYMF